MPRTTKSKEDLHDAPPIIIEETNFEGGSSSDWLNDDLPSLIQSPLEVQLRAILGSADADSFLNPTIKDKKKVTLADSGINVSKKQDARELWNNLRSQSQRKLNKKEKDVPYDAYNYNNKKLSDNRIVRNIQFSRHRTELMHRVSQMNRNKTKELLKDFYFPSFDDEFNPLKQIEVQTNEQLSCEQLPERTPLLKINDESALESTINKEKLSEYSLKIRYLSEEDCSSPGMFRERMKDLGVVVKNGVSLMDNTCKGSSSSSLIGKEYKQSSSSRSVDVASKKPQEARRWEPLTMVALEEQREPIASKD